jgi:hypothetical protein
MKANSNISCDKSYVSVPFALENLDITCYKEISPFRKDFFLLVYKIHTEENRTRGWSR